MTKMIGLNFSEALTVLLRGGRVSREGWNGAGMWIQLQIPDEDSEMKRPYLYMSPIDGQLVPWVASQTDILAEDWLVL